MYDIYVLAPNRNPANVRLFLNKWAAGFREASADYPYPQYSESPIMVYPRADQIIERLIQDRGEYYALYWTNPDLDATIRAAMLSFTSDEELIVGISTTVGMSKSIQSAEWELKRLLDLLMTDMGGQAGFIVWEQPPPETAGEFRQFAAEFVKGSSGGPASPN